MPFTFQECGMLRSTHLLNQFIKYITFQHYCMDLDYSAALGHTMHLGHSNYVQVLYFYIYSMHVNFNLL